jgi:Rrf2 family protein
MHLSQTNIYALHASLLLAKSPPGVPVPCSQLAREGKMPERFLVQVLRRLVKHGLLRSSCGVAGGYFLARSPQLITLRDIIDAIENAVPRRPQAFEFVSRGANDRVAATLRDAENAARSEFQKLSLASLVGENEFAKHLPPLAGIPAVEWSGQQRIPTH